MKKNLLLLMLIFSMLSAITPSCAAVSIGVKEGDWIEYQVSTTGTTGEGHNVVWAKIEVLSLRGNEVIINATTKAVNGTYSSVIMTLNPEKGNVDVWAIIPANLSTGDSFLDKNFSYIPIEGEEEKIYGGAIRDTTYYNSTERFKRWDKATGVFLEGTDVEENFSLTAVFDSTNMWDSQTVADQTIFYLLFAILVGSAVFIIIILVLKPHSKTVPLR